MGSRSARPLTIPRTLVATAIGLLAACPEDPAPIDDCPIYADTPTCEDGNGCAWDPVDDECVVDCKAIDERNTCNDQVDRCFWDGRVCHYGVL